MEFSRIGCDARHAVAQQYSQPPYHATMSNLRDAVRAHVSSASYRPAKPAVIAKALGLSGDATREVKKVIKQLIKAGELAWGPSHLVFPIKAASSTRYDEVTSAIGDKTAEVSDAEEAPSSQPSRRGRGGKLSPSGRSSMHAKSKSPPSGNAKHFTGTFRRAAGGFGFVRPEGTLPAAGRDADVFIPAEKCGDAANGDIVSVRLETKRGRMGKLEGRIIDVVERATNRFVGTYFEQAGMGLV